METDFYSGVYNPDVLSCIANLSNDEVFTPPEIANAMLDLLPQELFLSPDTTFLDPACKSGVFLREIAKRLLIGLEGAIPDLQERIDHIFQKQLYGIAITEMTSLLSRRSTYCSKYPNSKYSVSTFADAQGNIRFKRTLHKWKDGRCVFCGASQSQYDRDAALETHAYEFIHTVHPERIFDMKFDVIIGNPPYQLSDGGAKASAKPLYHHFVMQAMKLNPRYITMIIPARWYAGGKGLDEFRAAMITSKKISILTDIVNSADCFSGVNIAGGICYFLWDREYSGECLVRNMSKDEVVSEQTRSLNEFNYFVRSNTALSIIRKAISHDKPLSKEIFSRNYFGVQTTMTGSQTYENGMVQVLMSKGKTFIRKQLINDRDHLLSKYKVIITYAMSGGNKPGSDGMYQVVSSEMILLPNEACSETYLIIGVFNSLTEAQSMLSYIRTRTFRFLLLQALTSIHITKDKFCFVPQQIFNVIWTDEELYAKYGLTEEEIAFIESMIRPMDVTGGGSDE